LGEVGHGVCIEDKAGGARDGTGLQCIMSWERVYTVNEFWDRARLGVADVDGIPHIYSSPFDISRDDFLEYYLVSPIDPELLKLVLEDWEIWIRWSDAFDRGKTSRNTHPSLPEDRVRHEEIVRLIGGKLIVDILRERKLYARFRRVASGWNGFEVEWSENANLSSLDANPHPE
jgi:hypothetical protein